MQVRTGPSAAILDRVGFLRLVDRRLGLGIRRRSPDGIVGLRRPGTGVGRVGAIVVPGTSVGELGPGVGGNIQVRLSGPHRGLLRDLGAELEQRSQQLYRELFPNKPPPRSVVSAMREASSIPASVVRISGGTFLFSFTY